MRLKFSFISRFAFVLLLYLLFPIQNISALETPVKPEKKLQEQSESDSLNPQAMPVKIKSFINENEDTSIDSSSLEAEEEETLLAANEGDDHSGDTATKTKKPKAPKSVSIFMKIMPLGLGFFASGMPGWGVFYATSQITGGVYSYINWQKENALSAQTNTTIAQRNSEETKQKNQKDADAYHANTVAYVNSQQVLWNKYDQQRNLGLALAVGSYFIGVLHCIISKPSAPTKKKVPGKDNKPESAFLNGESSYLVVDEEKLQASNFSFELNPYEHPINGNMGLAFDLTYRF